MDNSTRDRELEVVRKQLREEATFVKDCFTKFSFQAIAFASVVLGIIVRFEHEDPWVALAAIPVFVLLLSVARIGTYK